MKSFKNTIQAIDSNSFNNQQILSILLLCVNNLEINTISEMARSENKTPKGIRESNNYKKIKIGKQLLAVKGIKQDNLPFD